EVPPDGAAAEAAGLPRLRQAAAFGEGGAVGQRHDQRGVVDPQLPGAEPARGARAPGSDGRGGSDDGGAGGGARAPRAGDPLVAAARRGAQPAPGGRLQHAERVGQGGSDHPQLHGLREAGGVEAVLEDLAIDLKRHMMRLLIVSEYIDENQNSTGYFWSKIIN